MHLALRLLAAAAVALVVAIGAFWWLTAPSQVTSDDLAGLTGDAAAGEQVFLAAGCAACHAAPDAEGDARLALAGGEAFQTEFGTFYAPNISQHPEAGIGDWSDAEIVTAVMEGVSPGGAHYYPAFPWTAYGKAERQDIVDLTAYLRTLPEDATESRPNEVDVPFGWRRLVGGWKLLFEREAFVLDVEGDELVRGRYLVEALGHCAECHTPRNALGGLRTDRWLAGAANPSGDGRIPGLTPDELSWSADDIAYYLETGFTPNFDSAGGAMAEVVTNTAQLPAEDRAAIAAYVKALPAVTGDDG